LTDILYLYILDKHIGMTNIKFCLFIMSIQSIYLESQTIHLQQHFHGKKGNKEEVCPI